MEEVKIDLENDFKCEDYIVQLINAIIKAFRKIRSEPESDSLNNIFFKKCDKIISFTIDKVLIAYQISNNIFYTLLGAFASVAEELSHLFSFDYSVDKYNVVEIAWLSLDNMTIPSIIRSITFIHSEINAKFLRQPIQQWEGFIGILYVLLKLNVTLVYSHRIVFPTKNKQ